MLHTCHLGGGHRHDRTGNMAVATARHVTACSTTGHTLLAEGEAGQYLHIQVCHRGALRFGKALDVVVREGDVLLEFGGDSG